MGITSAIVLFTIIWALTFFVALPIRVQTQGDLGEIVPGTHAGAPQNHHLKKKAIYTTVAATVIWAIAASIITSGRITVADVERWLHPIPSVTTETGG